MGDVLSDRAAWDLCDRCGKHGREWKAMVDGDGGIREVEGSEVCSHPMIREAERATIAALAARSGVDVGDLVATAAKATHCCCRQVSEEEWDHSDCLQHCQYPMIKWDATADALRLALATAEARHAEREAMWQALVEILSTPIGLRDYDELRRLRRALGLEG